MVVRMDYSSVRAPRGARGLGVLIPRSRDTNYGNPAFWNLEFDVSDRTPLSLVFGASQ
jgi:hypothetical protein